MSVGTVGEQVEDERMAVDDAKLWLGYMVHLAIGLVVPAADWAGSPLTASFELVAGRLESASVEWPWWLET